MREVTAATHTHCCCSLSQHVHAAHGSMSSSTCLCCDRSFVDHVQQRAHYQSEWHRYNLKRKVAQLKSVSETEFATLQSLHQQQQVTSQAPAAQHLYCQPCGKLFATDSQWQNHLKSNKHVDTVRTAGLSDTAVLVQKQCGRKRPDGDEEEWESVSGDSDEHEDDDAETSDGTAGRTCLFCEETASDLAKCLEHMSVTHSFFLPDAEFVTDVEGLLLYLGEKVRSGRICLWCNEQGKSFDSLRSVQQHMIDKGHCKVRLEPGNDILEFSDFYDYSSSYPDAGSGDDEVRENAVEVNADMELVLPSGVTVGHRTLKMYYKQNLSEKEAPIAVTKKKRTMNGRQLMSQYQSLGYRSTTSLALAAKARDMQFIQKRMMRLGIKNNKLQRHFRSQIDF